MMALGASSLGVFVRHVGGHTWKRPRASIRRPAEHRFALGTRADIPACVIATIIVGEQRGEKSPSWEYKILS